MILDVFASEFDARDFIDGFPRQEDGRPSGYDYIHVSEHEVAPPSWSED